MNNREKEEKKYSKLLNEEDKFTKELNKYKTKLLKKIQKDLSKHLAT